MHYFGFIYANSNGQMVVYVWAVVNLSPICINVILSQLDRYELNKVDRRGRPPLPNAPPVTANMAYNTITSKPEYEAAYEDMDAGQVKEVDKWGRPPLPQDPPVTANMAYNTVGSEPEYEATYEVGQVNYPPQHTAATTQDSYVSMYEYVQ